MRIIDLNVGDRFRITEIVYGNSDIYVVNLQGDNIEITNEMKESVTKFNKKSYLADHVNITLVEEAKSEIEWIAEKKINNE